MFNVLLNKEEDGSIREVSCSALKANMGYLDIPMSGRYFRKVDHDRTWMTVVHEINFKDKNLPEEVINVYHKHNAYQIDRIRKAVTGHRGSSMIMST